MIENPWTLPCVAIEQRALVDAQLADFDGSYIDGDMRSDRNHPHFFALCEAVRSTQCPGSILEVGCGSGYGREILDRAGVEYRSYAGVDINAEAIRIAKERYPESEWVAAKFATESDRASVSYRPAPRIADVVIDGSCILHVDEWKEHLGNLCRVSRRNIILHRIPLTQNHRDALFVETPPTERTATHAYGQTFPAWLFNASEVDAEMSKHGFVKTASFPADGGSSTLVYAKPRHFVTYCDGNYLTRVKALYASMRRHCRPFKLHVLCWDKAVEAWASGAWYEDDQSVVPWNLEGFFEEHPELALDRLPGPPRTRVEHMWTCAPAWIADVMRETGDPVCYLDSDLFAFSSPEPMLARVGGAPAGFSGHNFAPASRGVPGPTVESHAGPFGWFNVGALAFNDIRVAEDWAALCYAHCYDKVEVANGARRFADQGYLEDLARAHPGIVDLDGSEMVGPWNIHARSLDLRDGVPHFGGKPVGFFHFSGLRILPDGHDVNTRPEYALTRRQADIVYAPYWRALTEAMK